MIQRVQSIFLLIASILSSIMLLTPVSYLRTTNGETFKYYSYGFKNFDKAFNPINGALPVLLLLTVIALMSFVGIFFYKRRNLQMTLCKITIILLVLLIVLICYNYAMVQKNFGIISPSIYNILSLPAITILAHVFAIRGIHKDDLLLKSYDRLR